MAAGPVEPDAAIEKLKLCKDPAERRDLLTSLRRILSGLDGLTHERDYGSWRWSSKLFSPLKIENRFSFVSAGAAV
jgi:hypothetical protein